LKKNFLSSLIWVALGFSLFSCVQTKTSEYTQTQNGITAVFSMSPETPTMMESVTLSLALTDISGQVIEGAQVTYDLTMPGMTMPPNQPQASEKGNGFYKANTTFTMAGDWRAEIAVDYGGETITFTFNFTIK
jgi:hypothetical protein